MISELILFLYIDFSNVFDNFYQCVRLPPSIKLSLLLHYFTQSTFFLMTPEAEKFNGWAAMLGFVAAFGAYASTGQIIPGIF